MSFKFSFSSDDERRQLAAELDQFINDLPPVPSIFEDTVAPVSGSDVFLLPDQSTSARLGDSIEKLLLNAPLVWSAYDRDGLSASEVEALNSLTEAGLVEQQYFQIRRSKLNDFGFYVQITGCGQNVFFVCEQIEATVDPLFDNVEGLFWVRIPPRMWRLTSEGELARKDLLEASKRIDGRHVKRSIIAFITAESAASGRVAGAATTTEPVQIWKHEFDHVSGSLSAEHVDSVIASRTAKTPPEEFKLTTTDRYVLEALQRRQPQTKQDLAMSAVTQSEASSNIGKSLTRLKAFDAIEAGGRGRGSDGYRITEHGRNLLKTSNLK